MDRCWIHVLLHKGLTPCPQFIHAFIDRAYSPVASCKSIGYVRLHDNPA